MFHRRRRRQAPTSFSRDRRRLRPELMFLEERVVLTAPTVSVSAANVISATAITLNGSVNANGTATTVEFQYSTSPTFLATV